MSRRRRFIGAGQGVRVLDGVKESVAGMPRAAGYTISASPCTVVDCSDAEVAFVETEGDIDVHRFAHGQGEEKHRIREFLSLVPEL